MLMSYGAITSNWWEIGCRPVRCRLTPIYLELSENVRKIINTTKFEELASRWKNAPLIKKINLRFLLARRDGFVNGFE